MTQSSPGDQGGAGDLLAGRRLLLGVTGSIAAYKAADLASRLAQAGALVDVVMTRSALEFVTPLTFRSLTHRPVVTELFDAQSELSMEHVALAERAEAVVVAPATANLIAKAATGMADDLLTCILLATRAPVVIAPAMDGYMYQNPATQENLSRLSSRGYVTVGPVEGRLASGQVGMGRLAEIEEIIGAIRQVLGRGGDLSGATIVVTAGGTQEPIDPVRHLSNRSSGKMGYALAEGARDRGARVVLISAPTSLPAPFGVEMVRVETAREMRDAVLKAGEEADALIMAAAVADYRPTSPTAAKIKKSASPLTLQLEPTADILGELKGRDLVKVGFAAESHDLMANARQKLRGKGLDLIVANDITAGDSGFATDSNRVVLITSRGEPQELPLMLKSQVAHKVLDRVVALLSARARGRDR
ncbi:MAG: bifunctional phosphopantothenoylcysteine decarboxylase/phosphopantothenate--cysteine ligase CoaBC [Dehalococcoidia bacterium]